VLEHGFRTVAQRAGLVRDPHGPFLVLYRRRLYLNLSLAVEVAERLPGISAADAERLLLGGGAAGGARPRLALSDVPRLLAAFLRLLHLRRALPREIEAVAAEMAALPSADAIAARDDDGLARALRDFEERGRRAACVHILASGASAFRLAVLGRVLGALAPGDAA